MRTDIDDDTEEDAMSMDGRAVCRAKTQDSCLPPNDLLEMMMIQPIEPQ